MVTVKKGNPITLIEVDKSWPKTVKIGYRDIQIDYVRPEFKTDDMTESYGEYRAREGKILLQHDLCGQEMANVLLHEALHAIVCGSGLNQANGTLKEDDAEEIVVNQIANYLMGMFRDNDWFLDFIKKNMNQSKT